MDRQREWWARLPRVFDHPATVFAALREPDESDVAGRQEPLLLIVLLAGMSGIALTPAWRTLLDDPERTDLDGLQVAVLTFIGGGLYGVFCYFALGAALFIGAKGMGDDGPMRLARQVCGFAAAPLAAGFVLLLVRCTLYGLDIFREGGSDAGAFGDILLGLSYTSLLWSFGLLALGVRVVYGFSWLRVGGAVFMALVFFAAIAVIPSAV